MLAGIMAGLALLLTVRPDAGAAGTADGGAADAVAEAGGPPDAAVNADAPGTADEETPPPPGGRYDNGSCAACHKGLTKKKVVHSVFSNGGCNDCHAPAEGQGPCRSGLASRWKPALPDPRMCLRCHDKKGNTPLHPAIKNKGCVACHDPHASDYPEHMQRWPQVELCYGCHRRVDDGHVVHDPVKTGQCTGCHDAHVGEAAPLMKDETSVMCEDCHDPGDVAKISPDHAKDSGKKCEGCHDPHSSNQPHLMRDPVARARDGGAADGPDGGAPEPAEPVYANKDCKGCHDSLLAKKVVHGMFPTGGCPDCHAPDAFAGKCKSTVSTGWKLTRPDPALCLKCHNKSGNTPLHGAIRNKGCLACHDPHSSDYPEHLLDWPQTKLCYRCHRRKDRGREVHTAVKESKCTGCHDAHIGEAAPLMKAEPNEMCEDCHERGDLLKYPEQHAPVAAGRCLDCHDPHNSDFPKQTRAGGNDLCLGCHDPKVKRGGDRMVPIKRVALARKHVHKPVEEQKCSKCHAAHSAPNQKLLVERPPTLCYQCHERKDKQGYAHGAVALGDCAVCHDPHASDQNAMLRSDRIKSLCFECHQDDVSARKFVHKPVAEGRCDRCHDPHGAENPFNLKAGRGAAACVTCHKEKGEKPKFTHQALVRFGCTGCHDPHGTANRFQLIKPTNKLCISCHPKQSDGLHVTTMVVGGHKVSGGKDLHDPSRPFSCVSCHDPHGSSSPRILRYGESPMQACDWCHGDRSGKKPELIDLTKPGARPPKPPRKTDGPTAAVAPSPLAATPETGGAAPTATTAPALPTPRPDPAAGPGGQP